MIRGDIRATTVDRQYHHTEYSMKPLAMPGAGALGSARELSESRLGKQTKHSSYLRDGTMAREPIIIIGLRG